MGNVIQCTSGNRGTSGPHLGAPVFRVPFVCGAMALIFPRAPRFAGCPGFRKCMGEGFRDTGQSRGLEHAI